MDKYIVPKSQLVSRYCPILLLIIYYRVSKRFSRATQGQSTSRSYQPLLLLFQSVYYISWYFQGFGNNLWRRQRQPLRQTYIRYPVALVKFDPDQPFRLRGIFDIVAAVVWEHGGVARGKVKGARNGATKKYRSPRGALMKVEPFLGLENIVIVITCNEEKLGRNLHLGASGVLEGRQALD